MLEFLLPSTFCTRFYSLVTSNVGKSSSRSYGGGRPGLSMSKEIVAGRSNQSEVRILRVVQSPWTSVAEEMGGERKWRKHWFYTWDLIAKLMQISLTISACEDKVSTATDMCMSTCMCACGDVHNFIIYLIIICICLGLVNCLNIFINWLQQLALQFKISSSS